MLSFPLPLLVSQAPPFETCLQGPPWISVLMRIHVPLCFSSTFLAPGSSNLRIHILVLQPTFIKVVVICVAELAVSEECVFKVFLLRCI